MKYIKELVVTGPEGSVKGFIEVNFDKYSVHPFRSILGNDDDNLKMGVTVHCTVNGLAFCSLFRKDYVSERIREGTNKTNEALLLEDIEKAELEMMDQMHWIANGGLKSFELKMVERGFVVSDVKNEKEFTGNVVNP